MCSSRSTFDGTTAGSSTRLAPRAQAGVWSVSIADSVLSPLAACAQRTFVVTAAGAGPFDSHVGTLALFNVLAAGTAVKLREVATDRLDRAEAAWRLSHSLTDR